MSPATRAWLAFPAVGAGLIHLAIALAAPMPFAIVLGMFGAAEFFWGVLTFARETVPVARVALAVALLPTIVWGLVVAVGFAPPVSLFAMAGACLLELIVVLGLARHLRAVASGESRSGSRPQHVLGVVSALLVVAAVTGGSLAAASSPVSLPTYIPLHGH